MSDAVEAAALMLIAHAAESVQTREDMKRAAVVARAYLDLLSREVGWQEIGTAPEDGTEVIGVHFTDWGGGSTSRSGPWTVALVGGKWRSSWDGAEVIDCMSDFGTDYKSPDLDPTHWRALPSPPL